jgi:hypothetical protein
MILVPGRLESFGNCWNIEANTMVSYADHRIPISYFDFHDQTYPGASWSYAIHHILNIEQTQSSIMHNEESSTRSIACDSYR